MKYMGSKNRHAKEMLPIILANRRPDQFYIEPFAGGFNMIDKVDGRRVANDNNPYLIALFKAIQSGWRPPEFVSEEEYNEARRNNLMPIHLKGFIGFGCSFSGKWFGGYARGKNGKGQERSYCVESRNNILKQFAGLQGIVITCMHYLRMTIPPGSIVYCDPPYKGATGYTAGKEKFCHETFWEWVRMQSRYNTVFVSEYQAPPDFECVWEKKVNSSLTQDTGAKKNVERLFKLKS